MNYCRILDGCTVDVLPDGLPGDRNRVLVQESLDTANLTQDGADAACPVHVLNVIVGGRRDLTDIGTPFRNSVDTLQVVVDSGFMGH